MSFNFGGGTGGFSFTTPATTTAGSTGFSFASPTSTASGGTGGFTFAPPAAALTTTSSSGFSFNRPVVPPAVAPTAQISGAFSPATAPATQLTGAFSPAVASAAAPATQLSGAFSFSNPATSATQGSTLAASLSAPLAAPSQASASLPGGGFSFATTTAAASSAGGSFNFNVPTASTSGGTGFSLATTAAVPATAPAPAGGTTIPTASPFAFPSKPLGLTTLTTTTTQGAAITSSSGGLPSLFATTPNSQVQASAAPTSILSQAMSKAPSAPTSLASVPASGGLFSNVSAAPIPTQPPASTPLLSTTPSITSASLTQSVPAAISTAPLATLTTATSTSSASISGTTIAATPTLSVRGLEEKVNKWVSEIREQEERLMRQAAHVNSWDQLLQQGHDQVQQLRDTLNKVKVDQERLQAELDFIQGQQQELEQLIEPLESAVASTTPAQHQGDRQRDNMHHLAQNLDAQLHQMTDDLCKVIEHLNSNNTSSQASDPVNTVARVLSAHMDTLKWVDQNSALLTQKIDDLTRTADSKRRE